MTHIELNIKICEARGWTITPCGRLWTQDPAGLRGPFRLVDELPNHITGIEALGHMHKAEKLLTDEQHSEYRGRLVEVCDSLADALCASALQRAVAFALTLNLITNEEAEELLK